MRIAVIGAGIGGLVAAAGLQRDGHEVTVYERHATPGTVGAGLTLFANAFAALDAVMLGDSVRAVCDDSITEMRAGQRTPDGRWLTRMPQQAVVSLRSVYRPELHRVLADALAPGSLVAGAAAAVSADGSPVVTVRGRAETFDLVVAADGIRSDSRRLLGFDPGLRYAGYTVWRGVTTSPLELDDEAAETWGRGSLFGVVPLGDRRVYWFASLNAPEGLRCESEHAAVSERFGSWHEPIAECVAATAPDRVLRHDIYDLARMPRTFVKDRTVLLGDAAHAMTPNLGQGAGQSMEDAATLAVLLRDVDGGDDADRADGIRSALARYDAVRRARTTMVWRRSRLMGRVAQTSSPVVVAARDAVLRMTPGGVLAKGAAGVQRWDGVGMGR